MGEFHPIHNFAERPSVFKLNLTVSLVLDPEDLMCQGNKAKTAEVRKIPRKNLLSTFP